ncbi:hypothetical protein [Methylobacterium sp. JK268]
MARALSLIHGCLGLLREGWPMPRLPVDALVARVAETPRSAAR